MKPARLANIGHVWLLLPLIGVAIAAIQPIRDNSFLWHIRAGQIETTTGRVLTSDPFSLLYSGQPWRTQSWLLELLYDRLGGGIAWVAPYLAVVTGLTLLAVGVAIYQGARGVRVTAFFVIWVELLGLPYFTPRPVVVSFLMLSLLVLVLRSEKVRWTIPLLIWVWAAVHGSFVLGGGLIVLDGIAHRDSRRIVDAVTAGVAATLTAHGWHVWEILITFLNSSDGLSYMTEWNRPDLFSQQVLPFTVILGILGLLVATGRLPSRELWLLGPFAVFGLSTSRAVMPAGIVLIVLMVAGLPTREERAAAPSRLATALVSAIAVGSLVAVMNAEPTVDPARFPVAVAAAMEDVPTFHDDVVGGYLIFRDSELSAVFFDDRAEFYPSHFIRSVIEARSAANGWEGFLMDRGVEQVLLRRSDRLNEHLADSPGWVEVASDPHFVLWRQLEA